MFPDDQTNGKIREQYKMPNNKIQFFTAWEDLKQLLLELETQYHLKYIEVVPQGSGSRRETVFDTAALFLDAIPYHNRSVYVYDQLHRMVLYLEIENSWNRNGKFAGTSEALAIQNVFGDKLYNDFVAKVKEHFQEISEPHYGPFYISPILYAHRYNIIFSFNDPYFRIDGNGKAVHVWRKEWGTLLTQWGLVNEQM